MKYTYGNKNASHNRVGRLMLQEDASGAQEFFYGRLGEMTKVRRTLIIPNQAIATYVTQWKYDSWNRLEEMIYPDEEKITYSYNTAGLLESVKGAKAYSYNYVGKLGYDKFEQRIYMKYCNNLSASLTQPYPVLKPVEFSQINVQELKGIFIRIFNLNSKDVNLDVASFPDEGYITIFTRREGCEFLAEYYQYMKTVVKVDIHYWIFTMYDQANTAIRW